MAAAYRLALVVVLLAAISCLSGAVRTPGAPGSIHAGRFHLEHSQLVQNTGQWTQGDRCAEDARITLYIALEHSNVAKMEELFWQVSDPESPTYGHYLTLEELSVFAPDANAAPAVLKWIEESRQSNAAHVSVTQNGEWIKVQVDIATARAMLGGIRFNYYHQQDGAKTLRTIRSQEPYSVPREVARFVSVVGGVNTFPRTKAFRASSPSNKKRGEITLDPAQIKEGLNISAKDTGKSASNAQAVAQFLGQYFSPSDLTQFQQTFNVPQQQPIKVIGPNTPSQPGVEAELDIQYIMGIGNNIPTWFVSTGGTHEGQEPFLEWITYLINTTNTPWVHSISYGDVESSITKDYAVRVNQEFMKFGIMGRSILFASGDDGVGCNTACTKFEPNWPSTSPFVTSVGGSLFLRQPFEFQSDQISSGGFSNYFPRPGYQNAAVSAYLRSNGLPPSSFYNVSGRAVPDVAGFSEDLEVMYSGSLTYVGGTSCAAPVFSAVISLINDYRLQHGRVPLGFLNPILYSRAQTNRGMFGDIATGSRNTNGCCNGFRPEVGWDPTSGWGLPNFPGLLSALTA